MQHLVLGIGYSQAEYAAEKEKWNEYGIVFDFVDDISQATQKLACTEYVCVVICSDTIPAHDLTPAGDTTYPDSCGAALLQRVPAIHMCPFQRHAVPPCGRASPGFCGSGYCK